MLGLHMGYINRRINELRKEKFIEDGLKGH